MAAQLGYKGLKWQKSVGPEGRTAPWAGNQVLLWKQPHPIFFAELEYRLRPTRATLDKWADIIQGTAEHMADYPTLNEQTGMYSLAPAETAHRTVLKVWEKWNWDRCWGWDCPWMAMAAARVGEPRLAVEALLKDSTRNQFDTRGINTGGPCPYLPGNGGLLYAVAMMAAGWDGSPEGHAPGFPADGSWVVKWEGLKKAP